MQSTKLDGASGPVAFDQYGDTTNKVLTVYQVKGTDFAPDRDRRVPGELTLVTRPTPWGRGRSARPPRVRGEESGLLSTFLSQIVNGLVFGSLIGLIALGYTMVYGIIQLINFAHGEIFMVGAYGALFMFTYVLPTAWQQQWYLALPLLLLAAAAVSVLVAVAMERFAYRPLRGAPRLAPLITALGVSVALQEAVRIFYPNAHVRAAVPERLRRGHLGDPDR